MQENNILENGDFSALGLSNVSGQDVYYLELKCLSATIGNRHHMMAVLEHSETLIKKAQMLKVFLLCFLLLFKNVYTVVLRVILFQVILLSIT